MSQSSNKELLDLGAMFDKALSLQHQGNYEEAVMEYQKILSEDKSHIPSMLNLGAIYYVKSSHELALDYFMKVIEADSRNVNALYNAGKTLQGRKEWSRSLEYLRKAYEIDPKDPMLLKSLGDSYFELGFYEESYECLKNYLETNHDDVDSLMKFSECLVSLGQFEVACFGLKRVIDLDPSRIRAYELLSDCYYHLDRLEKSVSILTRLLQFHDDEAAVYRKLAMYYGQLKNFKEARKCYLKAYGLEAREIKVHETSERKRINSDIDRVTFQNSILSITEKYAAHNNWKGALQEFSQLSRRYPDSVILLQEIAYIYQVVGESKRSASYYERILQIEPDNLEALLQLIRISIDLDDLHMGEKYLEKALGLHEDVMEVHELGGALYVHFEKFQKALEFFEYCKSKGFDSCGVLLGSSQCYMGAGKFQSAIEILKRAVKIFPESVDLVLNLAHSYVETAELKEARSLMTKARKSFQGNLQVYAMSAKVAVSSRNYKKAREFFSKISHLAPQGREDTPAYIKALIVERDVDEALRKLKVYTRFRLKTFESLYLESLVYAVARDRVHFSIPWQELWGEDSLKALELVHEMKTLLIKEDMDFMVQVQKEVNRLYSRQPDILRTLQEFYRVLVQPTQLEVVK